MIEFAKGHACGNDFVVVVDEGQVEGHDRGELARAICNRTQGIGADGVEYLTRMSDREGRIRLYNADGSVAEISGNGTRCVAAWMAYQSRLRRGDEVRLETDAGTRVCRLQRMDGAEYVFTTGMGVPTVQPMKVRLDDGLAVEGAVVAMGNPQFVVVVDADFTVGGRSWQQVGEAICFHPDFPAQTNVEFVLPIEKDLIEIRIYERGVGPTSSSGTGTSASAAAMIALHGMSSPMRVRAPGGEQVVEWEPGGELLLTGPAVVVGRGEWLAGGAR